MEQGLVAGRSCGSCTVCCIALAIDALELRKPVGQVCPHCVLDQGCAVYESRPAICRGWFCGWRQLDWLNEALRPDLSGILIFLTNEDLPPGFAGESGIEVLPLTAAGLKAEGLAEALGGFIGANVATFLRVAGTDGRAGSRWLLNDDLKAAAAQGHKAALLRDFRQLYTAALFMDHGG
jgi:hypothetical protein